MPKEHEHVPFLTQMIVLVSNLGFQSISEHYERPCTTFPIIDVDILKLIGKLELVDK